MRRRLDSAWVLAALLWAAGCETQVLRPEAPRDAAPAESPEIRQQVLALAAHSRPDDHHRALDPLVGDWEVSLAGAPLDGEPAVELARGRASIHWILGGRFQRWTSTMEIAGQTSTTAGFLGYDKLRAEYQLMMISDLVSSMEIAAGRGSLREGISFALDPLATRGRVPQVRSVLRLVDSDTFEFEQLMPGPDGKERLEKRAIYRRRFEDRSDEGGPETPESAPALDAQSPGKGVPAIPGDD